jgi:hypothetical protein
MELRSVQRCVLGFIGVLVVACGGGQPTEVIWRNVTIDVPDGWFVYEESATLLSLSNEDIGPADDGPGDQPSGDVVSMSFTYEPDTLPADWRRFADDQGGELLTDRQLTLDDEVPATQLVLEYETLGTVTREMVVVIPSRGIVVLAQPVPLPGDTDAPQVFLDHVDTFLEVVESAQFGRPPDDGPG